MPIFTADEAQSVCWLDYGLKGQKIAVRCLAMNSCFIGSGFHPSSFVIGSRSPCPGGKATGCEDHRWYSTTAGLKNAWSYTPRPLWIRNMGASRERLSQVSVPLHYWVIEGNIQILIIKHFKNNFFILNIIKGIRKTILKSLNINLETILAPPLLGKLAAPSYLKKKMVLLAPILCSSRRFYTSPNITRSV
jgi:hypothetical protein